MYEDIMKSAASDGEAAERFIKLVEYLRAPDGCPWDRVQTHESLVRPMIEETYEAVEAIEQGNTDNLREELGDMLMQVVMQAQIAKEEGLFDFKDVANGITDKMISRHPHVFKDRAGVETAQDVLDRWDDYKKKEKEHKNETQTQAMAKIPRELPALLRADKVQAKAAKVGFDWDDVSGAFDKIAEETAEVQAARAEGVQEHIADEVGDLLFAVVNVARFLNVDPEAALNHTTAKFMRRFSYVEEQAAAQGRSLPEMSLEEMDALWNEAKGRGL